ncbi:MAG: peptidyl-prolyl cis-trans isomerase, partial [Spirochaetia bacterium]|nr:peptidyl-prolyl cis-trans isomerase [Spirochaetia bacterium]
KLTKTEIIIDKEFRDVVARVETLRKTTLSDTDRKDFFDSVVNDILFYQMCERDGIKASDAEVDAYLTRVKAQLGTNITDEQFESYLANQGIPAADLRSYYRKQILLQRWLMTTKSKEIAAIPPIGIDEVIKTYELYKAKLVRPDTVRIAFLFYPYKDRTETERTKAIALMKDLSERLDRGEAFDTLRLKAQGGGYSASKDALFFERSETFISQFGQKFFDTVFSLKDGTNSAPFENDAGWWIVRRLEYYPQRQLELSDSYRLGQQSSVQEYIGQLLAQQRESDFIKKALEELFVQLRKQADIKIIGKI